jgi:predicted RND superfamily exporter protein
MIDHIVKWVIHRPWLTLLLALIIAAAAAYGAKNLYLRGDYKVYFGDDNPQLNDFENMQKEFNKNDNAMFILAPKNGNVFTPETMEMIYKLTEDSWQIPFSTRVDSITNYQHTIAEEDDLIVEDLLLDPADATVDKLNQIKQVVHTEPSLSGKLVSHNSDVTIVNVVVQLPDKLNNTAEVQEIVAAVRDIKSRFNRDYPEVDIYLSGVVFMNNAFFENGMADITNIVPGMFIAILVMLIILLRSFLATAATLVIIIFCIMFTMGSAGWLGYYLSTPTVNVPTLIMTLAVADCVHVVSSMIFFMRKGKTKSEAIFASLHLNFMPIFITSATTAIGFLSFNFSDVPPFRDLGNLVAIGVMSAFLFSVTAFPAMLNLMPIKRAANISGQLSIMEQFAEFVVANRKILLPLSSIVIIGFAAMIPRNVINDVPNEYFSKSIDFRVASDFYEDSIGGLNSADISINTGIASGINNPEFLATLTEFTEWMRAQPEVTHITSLADTFKRLNKNMHGDDDSWYKIPDSQELAAQYLLLYEMSLPFGLDLNNQLNVDKSAVRLSFNIVNNGSIVVVDVEKRIRQWFADNAPDLRIAVASPSVMFAHIGDRNMVSMLTGTLSALLLISVLLVLALRSVKLGAISLIPNLAPAAIGFGWWGLFNGNVNLGLSVVSAMSLGIVVDDTVHFLAKYRKARLEGKNAEDAVRYSFATVGKALVITTSVLWVGFMILTLSNFALNANMGLLTATIIVIALLVDFLFLPLFLIMFDKRDYSQKLHSSIIQGSAEHATNQNQ